MNQNDGTGTDRPATGARNREWAKKGGLVAAGLLAGGLVAGTLSANAATPSTSTGTSSTGSTQQPTDVGGPRGGHGLDLSGTVTAVGSSSVTIKTSSATTAYTATSSSDIDKSGEAQLSDLAVGDAVTFSVESDGKTIDKLHTGDESKNMPTHPAGSGGSPEGGTTTG